MPLLLVGVNHKTTPLAVRERFALTSEESGRLLEQLAAYVHYAVVLATCNRTEIYTTPQNTKVGIHHLQRFLTEWTGIPDAEMTSYLYTHSHWAAVRHLFQVSAGLDSMILGEEQILGQVRNAMKQAEEQQALDGVLEAAFHHALRAGRQVRTETGISHNAVSVSSVSVSLAKSLFGSLEPLQVLVISAGEAGKLASRSLTGQGVRHLKVMSRSYQRAQELAQRMGGQALPYEQLGQALISSDFVITATGSPERILTRELVAAAMAQRRERPLLLIDIAVPRDVDPGVQTIPGVSLYNIDDVQEHAQRNLELRGQEVAKAEAIVEAEVDKFQRWWRTQEVAPTINALLDRAEEIRRYEVHKTLKKLPGLAEQDQARVEAMSMAIIKKLLHEPLTFLKEQRNGEDTSAAIRTIFRLDADGAEPTTDISPH